MKNTGAKKQTGEKPRYFIGQADIDWSDNRWENKGGWGVAPKRRKGYVGLWDRNIYKFRWFKIIAKSPTHYGYVVERNTPYPVGVYWSNTLEENKKYL